MWIARCALVCLACTSVVFARRSPNAADVEEYFLRGPGADRISADLIEDALLDVPGLVRKYGYPIEVHNVVTEDGYILELHRIPHGRDENNFPDPGKPAVLVLHGLLSSSADFVLMRPGVALGYILAEAGFDVWLGNARGNYYSRKHVTLDPDSREPEQFWHFSWEEIGSRDLPAMIDHILAVTGKPRLHYIGHSQGTTAFFVMGALRPEYNDKIISMQAFAPVAYMEHNNNILFVALAPYINYLEILGRLIGINEVLPRSPFFINLIKRFCTADEDSTELDCENLMFIFGGDGSEFQNTTMIPVTLGHAPAGISLRQLIHYGQLIQQDFFRRYNHGPLTNLRLYGTLTPPSFDLSLVTAPVFLHYAEVDTFAHLDDVDRLWRELGRPLGKIRVPHPAFTHVDFMWGTEAKSLVYDRAIGIMKSFGNS